MFINANAKINLTLDVLNKLPNGYHSVSMIMQEISLCDKIEINTNNSGKINLKVLNMDLPCDEGNIAYRAAKIFLDKINSDNGCEITIEKHIPVCAGLGGGSADGAAVLKGLNMVYGYPLKTDELLDLGLSLGADVPFCIMGKTCHAKGVGEVLTSFESKLNAYVALIKPDADISTPKAYKDIDALKYEHLQVDKAITALKMGDKASLCKYGANVFEYVCMPLHPEIEKIKNHFLSCGSFFSMMSGSGPTVFGLFENPEDAKKAVNSYNGICLSKHVCEFV
ncbi:MAG: 4-(cytidine 5'-diphospho)-2-C-methyl-D-erythritol kinase [Clostridia bacterium]|nr:4-(cytidine 5'-diphospho)-2-C-methyl-D-erythritol kinase [Clostridia bacterium]